MTLNATVSPAVSGTVQFEVGTTDIGTPVTVASGAASASTTTLPVGTDNAVCGLHAGGRLCLRRVDGHGAVHDHVGTGRRHDDGTRREP